MNPFNNQPGPAHPAAADDDVYDDDEEDEDDNGGDDSFEEREASGTDEGTDEDEEDIYPPEFPLSPAVYEQDEIAEDEADIDLLIPKGSDMQRDLGEFRKLESLYPFFFLDPDGVWGQSDPNDVPVPLGQLRLEKIQKLVDSGGGGQARYVEFVPPWTDPDWSSRFIFTGAPGQDPANDPQYMMYAKQGILQSQRPALRDEDGLRDLTAASKRYGVDPTMMDDAMYGKSGVTPTEPSFFTVRLETPRVTPSNQGVKDVIDVDDTTAIWTGYRDFVSSRGGYATEANFRELLRYVAAGNVHPDLGPACDSVMADAILRYLEGVEKEALLEEYQRVLFTGSTSNELVETGVWTMDKAANSDLITPLHDFFTKDKWELTVNRGARVSQNTGVPYETRKVYIFPNQQGEYCAPRKANEYFWLAIQPALQLASNVLNSDHPATWAWGDIYRMRPCQDSRRAGNELQDIRQIHRDAGVDRKDYFAVYLEEDPDEFYPEVARLKEMGFESIRWICEILKRCLTWEFNAKYTEGMGGSDAWGHQMAFTELRPTRNDPNRPFRIRISLSADYVWPLLVEEYSQAEKAACTFTLASTMVHELCHAVVFARHQLFHPNRVWLRLNPAWGAQIGEEALKLVTAFGYRQVFDDEAFDTDVVLRQQDGHDYFETETDAEEGWATEALYWGGAPHSVSKGDFLPTMRFLEDVMTMLSFSSWPPLEQTVYKLIPFTMIERFFTQSFWDQELQKWGPEAMKIWPLSPPRAYGNLTVFRWKQVEARFGFAARRWIQDVAERTKYDWEHEMLWRWLRELTELAVEPKMCMIRWYRQQRDWKPTDKVLWTMRNNCNAKAERLVAYLQQLFIEANNAPPQGAPLPPVEYAHFREAFAAMSAMYRTLSHEAATYQLITVDYHRQTDPQTKADIQRFYATNLRNRLESIHTRIATECMNFLDMFESTDQAVLERLSQNERVVDLLDNARKSLKDKFVAVQDAIRPVKQSFGVNPDAYVFNVQDFTNIKPIVAQDTAKRIEKTARQQLQTLTGPLLTIAQGWIQILERGERLRNAAEGSPDAQLNQKLTRAADFILALKRRQREAVTEQYPVPSAESMFQMLNTPGLLQPNQAAPDGSMRTQRFNTVSAPGQINPWQAVYAEASGFVPYQDPRTGLTRFYQANIPTEAGPSVAPAVAAQAQAQGQSLVGALAPSLAPANVQAPVDDEAAFRGLMQGLSQSPQRPGAQQQQGYQPPGLPGESGNAADAISALLAERGRQVSLNPEIAGHVVPAMYNRALQTVAGPNGAALVNTNVPGANNLFGMSAAQNSMANQQMEALIRQQALGPDPYTALANMNVQGATAPPTQLYEPLGLSPSQAYPIDPLLTPQRPVDPPPQNPSPQDPNLVYPQAPVFGNPPQGPQFFQQGGYPGPQLGNPLQGSPQWYQQAGYPNPQQGNPPQGPPFFQQGGYQGQQPPPAP